MGLNARERQKDLLTLKLLSAQKDLREVNSILEQDVVKADRATTKQAKCVVEAISEKILGYQNQISMLEKA